MLSNSISESLVNGKSVTQADYYRSGYVARAISNRHKLIVINC